MAHPYWPLFDLVVRTPVLELRFPTDELLVELAEVAAKGIHADDWMPFAVPWSKLPSPQLERQILLHNWQMRGQWTPDHWRFNPVTVVHGRVVGTQGVHADEFGATRTVATGSWLGQAFQGKGYGKEMRSAMLHLAFAGLGAIRAESAAREDNGPSIGVSRAVGYAENGDEIRLRDGELTRDIRFLMTREVWEQRRRDDIEIEGLEPCLELFGVEKAADARPGVR